MSILFSVNDLFLLGELPNDLKYLEPEPLLKTEGLSWQFQRSDELMNTFKDALLSHYENFISKRIDKISIPIYLILAGSGTGKSRIATELPQLAKDCAVNNPELQERLESALVFNISFENGTALDTNNEKDPGIAIGSRMLFQLLPNWHNNWNKFKDLYKITPVEILEKVAKNLNKKLEDLIIFITIDGMQAAEKRDGDGLNKTSLLYSYLTTISNLARSKLFIIGTCTATTHRPIEQYLASSTQKRVFLPTVSLSPPTYLINKVPQKVFPDHPVVNMLVDDMGGHGRALEVLQNSLYNRDIDNCNFLDLMNNIRTQLEDRYNYWLTKANEFKPLLRVILAHQIIELDCPIPGTIFFPEDYTRLGLVKFEGLVDSKSRRGYLTCPYIWLWMIAHFTNDPILRDWDFSYIKETQHMENTSFPPGLQYWQHFEHFVARIRVLKSDIFDNNEWISLGKLYDGARHSFGDDAGFHNQHLQLEVAKERIPTQSSQWRNVQCENNIIEINKYYKYCIINAPNAPAGDFVCGICTNKDKMDEYVSEVHQCKLLKKGLVNQKIYMEEHKKAAAGDDVFILYTCGESRVDLPKLSAIVDKDCWNAYFGIFAGRTFMYARMDPPNLNTATTTQLTGIKGIGNEYARTILGKRPFKDLDDCESRTKIPRTLLEQFQLK